MFWTDVVVPNTVEGVGVISGGRRGEVHQVYYLSRSDSASLERTIKYRGLEKYKQIRWKGDLESRRGAKAENMQFW